VKLSGVTQSSLITIARTVRGGSITLNKWWAQEHQ